MNKVVLSAVVSAGATLGAVLLLYPPVRALRMHQTDAERPPLPALPQPGSFFVKVPEVKLYVPTVRRANTQYRKPYRFRQDWFSYDLPPWEVALDPLKGKPDINYLEVGVYEGRSFFWVLENVCTHPTSTLTAVDAFLEDPGLTSTPWGDMSNYDKIFYANVKLSGAEKRIKVRRGFSQIELRSLPLESYDLIYIDGSHVASDVLEDAVLSWRLLRPGGILIFDDYVWNEPGPEKDKPTVAIDGFYSFFGDRMEVLHRDVQVILKKNPPKESKG